MPRWLLFTLLVPAALIVWLGPTTSPGQSPEQGTGGSAQLELNDASNLTALPATVSGVLRNYHRGAEVTFHLDSPDGPVLGGDVAPHPLGADGSASVRVTIPEGTPNGEHAIYAVGTSDDGVAGDGASL